jgi:uncharacterized protein
LGNGAGIEEILGPYRAQIRRIGLSHRARRIRVFGSVRRREADGRSDIDLLVDWRRDATLLDVAELRISLRGLLGRNVDVVEPSRLHWALSPQVLAEAVDL